MDENKQSSDFVRTLFVLANEDTIEGIQKLFPKLKAGSLAVTSLQEAYDAVCEHHETLIFVVVSEDLPSNGPINSLYEFVDQIRKTDWHRKKKSLILSANPNGSDNSLLSPRFDSYIGHETIQTMTMVVNRYIGE